MLADVLAVCFKVYWVGALCWVPIIVGLSHQSTAIDDSPKKVIFFGLVCAILWPLLILIWLMDAVGVPRIVWFKICEDD